jgi:hypothetical protein
MLKRTHSFKIKKQLLSRSNYIQPANVNIVKKDRQTLTSA